MTTHALSPTLDPALEAAIYLGRICANCGEIVAEADWLDERL